MSTASKTAKLVSAMLIGRSLYNRSVTSNVVVPAVFVAVAALATTLWVLPLIEMLAIGALGFVLYNTVSIGWIHGYVKTMLSDKAVKRVKAIRSKVLSGMSVLEAIISVVKTKDTPSPASTLINTVASTLTDLPVVVSVIGSTNSQMCHVRITCNSTPTTDHKLSTTIVGTWLALHGIDDDHKMFVEQQVSDWLCKVQPNLFSKQTKVKTDVITTQIVADVDSIIDTINRCDPVIKRVITSELLIKVRIAAVNGQCSGCQSDIQTIANHTLPMIASVWSTANPSQRESLKVGIRAIAQQLTSIADRTVQYQQTEVDRVISYVNLTHVNARNGD